MLAIRVLYWKINEGNFGAGFKNAALLALTAYLSLVISQQLLGGLFTINNFQLNYG
jgi:hypothetical protein